MDSLEVQENAPIIFSLFKRIFIDQHAPSDDRKNIQDDF